MAVINKSVLMARKYISSCVSDGDRVIDATCGNGHDTLFLAKIVGEKGKVFSFDIQPEALVNTRRLLEANNLADRVHLIQSGHERMDSHVHEKVAAVMFNLGYLPGGNHKIITRPDTTVEALAKACSCCAPAGSYRGCLQRS